MAASGKHRAPCESEERCFMQTDSRMKQKMANEKDPSAPLGMTIRETAFLIFPFIPRRFQPPPLRGTSFHEKEGECRLHGLLMKKAVIREYRLPAFVISSECEKSFSFAARQRMRGQRKAGSGKHHAPCESEERCFMQTDSRMKQKMTNEKDPSTALGMTIRENGLSHIPFYSFT